MPDPHIIMILDVQPPLFSAAPFVIQNIISFTVHSPSTWPLFLASKADSRFGGVVSVYRSVRFHISAGMPGMLIQLMQYLSAGVMLTSG